jgi:hypothetical protein
MISTLPLIIDPKTITQSQLAFLPDLVSNTVQLEVIVYVRYDLFSDISDIAHHNVLDLDL